MKKNKSLLIFAFLGVATIACFAFSISFEALRKLAEESKMANSLLFPFLLDTGIVVFSVSACVRRFRGVSCNFEHNLEMSVTIISLVLNVAAGWNETQSILATFMHGLPTVILFFSTACLIRMVSINAELQIESQKKASATRALKNASKPSKKAVAA